jgi:VWFA-related protein
MTRPQLVGSQKQSRATKVFSWDPYQTAVLVVMAVAATLPAAAQMPAAAGSSALQAEADPVRLDLAVRDRHNKPVLDLKPQELSVTDNGARIPVNDLRLVNGKGQADPLITLFFERPGMTGGRKGSDDYMFGRSPNAARETSRQLRDAASKFLRAFPGSGVEVSVVDAWGRLQIQQGYTSDRKALTKAINAAVNPEVYGTRVVANAEEQRQIQIAKTGQDAGKPVGGTRQRALARTMYAAMRASSHVAKDQHLPLSLACLLALVEAQQSIPGQKAIAYFATPGEVSGGDSNWQSQDSHAKAAIRSIIGAANRAGVTIYVVIPDEVQDTSRIDAIYSMAGMNMSSNTGVVDITGNGNPMMGDTTALIMASMASPKLGTISAQENLNVLARQTGGDVLNASARMGGSIRSLLDGLTTYYEASFVPPTAIQDGSFHETAFKTSRRGLRMRARTGYLALPLSAGISEPPQPFELPLIAVLKQKELPREIDYRAGVLRMGLQEQGNVHLLALEVPVNGLEVREDVNTHLDTAHVSVLATITDTSGMVVERFSEDMARRWAAGKNAEAAPSFISFERSFAAPAGKYILETAILDNYSGKAGSARQPFEVVEGQPDLELGDLLIVRGMEPIDNTSSEPDLLWRSDQRVFPNLYGELPPGVHNLSVFFIAHPDPKSQEPATVELTVLRDGTPLKGKPLTESLKATDESVPVVKSFAISSAADGHYQVRATLTQGGKTTASSGEFTLTGEEKREIASANPGTLPDIDPPGLTAEERAEDGTTPEEAEQILTDVRKNALNYSDTLPNLICQQVTTRYTDSRGNGNWDLKDRIVEVLTYVDRRESRTTVAGEVNHQKKDEKNMSHAGMISTGEFGVALSNIFTPASRAVFTRKGMIMLHGEPVESFDYRIEQANSQFALTVPGESAKVGYHGRVYVDRSTRGVRSITIIADDVPNKFPIRSAAVRVDYDYVALNDHDYLLPISAQVIAGQGRNMLERNDLQFSNFRKFGSTARIIGAEADQEAPQ